MQRRCHDERNRGGGAIRYMKFGFVFDSTYCHITAQCLRASIPESNSIHFDLNVLKSNVDIKQLLLKASERGKMPDVIVHETAAPGLPHGLDRISIPSACLDIDTFGWTNFRLRWGMLFDYVFTWHPSCVQQFQELGHPRVFAIPHAVDIQLFGGAEVDSERFYDIGFVGRFGSPQYHRRDRVISGLSKQFRANDFRKNYSTEEMVELYERSKVVVNVSRSEFPSEANMRCYEAMAAGALLITGLPSELTEWGFREGEHFIGWRSEGEIAGLVDRFLHRREERLAIARAGQERTLSEFTYQRCVETMTEVIERDEGQLLAPARSWSSEMVHLLYLSYYHRFQLPAAALEEFRLLRNANPRAYWKGLPMVLKTLRHTIKSSLM
jgi:glycosyltransferase involved in cell wall biosynthesis